jgi:hypothetical protein
VSPTAGLEGYGKSSTPPGFDQISRVTEKSSLCDGKDEKNAVPFAQPKKPVMLLTSKTERNSSQKDSVRRQKAVS